MTWQKVKLGDVCDVEIGRTPSRSNPAYWGEGHRWLSIADMNQGRELVETKETITQKGVQESGSRLVQAGTVLLSFKLSIGKVGIAKVPLFTNEAIAALPILKPELLCTDFLYWALKSVTLTRDVDKAVKGLTLNKPKLLNIEIPLPPLPEQKRLAAILDRADDLRRVRRQVLEGLDELARSLFLELFGDPAANPKGWDVVRLNDCCSKIIDCPHSTPTWTSEGITCVRTSNLSKGDWDWTDHRFVSESEYDERTRRSSVAAGDIVLSREGTVGVAAVVQSDMKICMGQRLVQLRPLPFKTLSSYLLFLLLDELSPERITNSMAGSTSKHFNVGDLRNLKVPLPPLELQQKFAAQIEELEAVKARARASMLELDALFASLQARAFAGELSPTSST